MRWSILLFTCTMVVMMASGCAAEPEPESSAPPGPSIEAEPEGAGDDGSPGPRLQLELLDGSGFDLADQRGSWVVVNFWATWCAPCLKEIPDLSSLHEARDDLMVIGLAYEDIDPDAMRAFLERVPAAYPIAILDPYSDRPAGDFDTPRGLPMTYLIAPGGEIARRFLGPVTSADINQAIDAHEAG